MAPAPLTSASVAMAAELFPPRPRPAQWSRGLRGRSTRKWRLAGAPGWARGAGGGGGRAVAVLVLLVLVLVLLLVPRPCQSVSAQQ